MGENFKFSGIATRSSVCAVRELGAKNALQGCHNVNGNDNPYTHYVPALLVGKWLFVAEGIKLKIVFDP